LRDELHAYIGHGVISKKNRKLFQAWAKEDPVDDWERERCRRIERLQVWGDTKAGRIDMTE